MYRMTDLTPSEIAESRACASSLTLVHNTTYYSTLTVFNGAMNMQSTTVISDGGKQGNQFIAPQLYTAVIIV